jgi:hypothetical protein
LAEWELAGETEIFEENLLQFYFLHHKSNVTWLGIEPGPQLWKAGVLWHDPSHYQNLTSHLELYLWPCT